MSLDNWENTETKKFDSLTGTWNISENTLFNRILTALVRFLRWGILKYVLTVVFFAILALVGYSAKDKKLAEDMASKAAYGNHVGMYDIFVKSKKPKIKITNDHPLYSSIVIKGWEEEFSLNFSKLFQYITIEGENGKEDLIVMKNKAFKIEGEDKTPVKLERSTIAPGSAKNICEDYFGEIPNEYQKSFYDRKRHIRIRGIKDELTYENDDGAKYFRCVLDQETIDDLLNE